MKVIKGNRLDCVCIYADVTSILDIQIYLCFGGARSQISYMHVNLSSLGTFGGLPPPPPPHTKKLATLLIIISYETLKGTR